MPAPIGNDNARKGKESTRALEQALSELSGGAQEAEQIERFTFLKEYWKGLLVSGAAENDLAVMKEISDRLEGRPAQAVNLGGQDDNPIGVNHVIYEGVTSDGSR